MDFEYTGYWYVSEDDLNEMAQLVRDGHNVKDAILTVADYWDDESYSMIDLIIDKLVEEVLRKAGNV